MENEVVEFLQHFAQDAGKIALSLFRSRLDVDTKSDGTPVTMADKRIEELFRSEIAKRFPGHSVIGEEFGTEESSGRYSWIIDPIDGTKSFACGILDWGTIAAFCIDGEPVIGLISHPLLREVMIGTPSGTRLNGRPVFVSEPDGLSQAVLLTCDHHNYPQGDAGERFKSLLSAVKMTRSFGNCYAYLLLAAGHIHISIDPVMAPWDTRPLIPVVRGAGGIITDYAGNDANTGASVIAATPGLHALVVEHLSGAPQP